MRTYTVRVDVDKLTENQFMRFYDRVTNLGGSLRQAGGSNWDIKIKAENGAEEAKNFVAACIDTMPAKVTRVSK